MHVKVNVLKGAQVLGTDFKYYLCCNVLEMIALCKWEKIIYSKEWNNASLVFPCKEDNAKIKAMISESFLSYIIELAKKFK